MGLIHLNEENFDDEIIKSDKPALVDFWAPWCGPCKAIGPIVEEIAVEFEGKVKVAKMNLDDAVTTSAKYGIRSIPTLMMFKDGNVVDTLVGLVPKERLTAFIEKNI